MVFNFTQLTDEVREKMMDELLYDISHNSVYMSKRFNENGRQQYLSILKLVIIHAEETTFIKLLQEKNCFVEYENTKKGMKKITESDVKIFAEGEFNHYYMRAICSLAIEQRKHVIIYRAKESETHRKESEESIGNVLDPVDTLNILRMNRFGNLLPIGKYASGLSLQLTL